MPELPEVETIVRYLRPRIRGRRILDLQSNTRRLFRDHRSITEVKKKIAGAKIKEIERIGKNIILHLSNGLFLGIHLMMTGALLFNPKISGKYDRCLLKLSGQNKIVYSDIRKFGRWRLLASADRPAGPDALCATFNEFKNLLYSRTGVVKNLLLNQSIISGIGNIYSDEILWQAGLHPLRRANSLSGGELKGLYAAIKSVLQKAIQKEGSSMTWYRKPDGGRGGYYEIRRVYRRTGERCARDDGLIERIVIGGRSTHFCPRHQL